MIHIILSSTLYFSKCNLVYRPIFIIVQDIQNNPKHCKNYLNPQRKFWSTDTTRYLNIRLVTVNFKRYINFHFLQFMFHLNSTFRNTKSKFHSVSAVLSYCYVQSTFSKKQTSWKNEILSKDSKFKKVLYHYLKF